MEILEKYQKINNSFKKEVIFNFGQVGLYSEFNNMILSILYCLENKIKFKIYSKDAVFALGNGWNDYFLPFCQESLNPFHRKLNSRMDCSNFSRIHRTLIFLYRIIYNKTFLTNDVFLPSRTTLFERSFFDFPSLGIKGDLRESAKYIIDMIYRFNSETQQEINHLINTIKLPKKYISIHVRGGDKNIEHELFTTDKYINKAIQISPIREAFILTDDYSVYEKIKINFPEWNFFSLTMEDEQGYDHSIFMKSSNDRKKLEMIKVFASIEIMKKSEAFIGTFSSNPGMFLGMCMPREKVYGIDYDNWLVF